MASKQRGVRVYGPKKTLFFNYHGDPTHATWIGLAAVVSAEEGFNLHEPGDCDLVIGKPIEIRDGPKITGRYAKWRMEVVDSHKPEVDPQHFLGYEDVIFLYTKRVKNPDSISEVKEYIRGRLP